MPWMVRKKMIVPDHLSCLIQSLYMNTNAAVKIDNQLYNSCKFYYPFWVISTENILWETWQTDWHVWTVVVEMNYANSFDRKKNKRVLNPRKRKGPRTIQNYNLRYFEHQQRRYDENLARLIVQLEGTRFRGWSPSRLKRYNKRIHWSNNKQSYQSTYNREKWQALVNRIT